MADEMGIEEIDDFTDPAAGGLDIGAEEEIIENPAEEPVGTIITQTLTDMPELDGLKIGDSVSLTVQDITDDGSYQLAVESAIELPGEEMALEEGAGPGMAGIAGALS